MNNQEDDLFEQALIDFEEESESSAEPIEGTIEERLNGFYSKKQAQSAALQHRQLQEQTLMAERRSLENQIHRTRLMIEKWHEKVASLKNQIVI